MFTCDCAEVQQPADRDHSMYHNTNSPKDTDTNVTAIMPLTDRQHFV